jgi:hypothetical protein
MSEPTRSEAVQLPFDKQGVPKESAWGGPDRPLTNLSAEADPTAPYSPETPHLPEITDLPVGPDIEPPSPEPEKEPGYTPSPEIPAYPPSGEPEAPVAPPPSPESPGGLPVVSRHARCCVRL